MKPIQCILNLIKHENRFSITYKDSLEAQREYDTLQAERDEARVMLENNITTQPEPDTSEWTLPYLTEYVLRQLNDHITDYDQGERELTKERDEYAGLLREMLYETVGNEENTGPGKQMYQCMVCMAPNDDTCINPECPAVRARAKLAEMEKE